MVAKAKRNIAFFSIEIKETIETNVFSFMTSLLSQINAMDKKGRKYKLSDDRFCLLSNCSFDDKLIKCIFISAKHGTRLPLIDEESLKSRDNPKTMKEGEEVHTHMLLKITDDECLVLLEQGRDLLQMNNICEYFNTMYKRIHNGDSFNPLSFSIIASESFEETLNKKISRLTLGEIYVSKQLLGSDSLNFSDRIDAIKEDVILQIKPRRNNSIKDVIVDICRKFESSESVIKRIRIKGKTESGADCIADTLISLIKKRNINVQKDEDTGAVNSKYIFSQMTEILPSV